MSHGAIMWATVLCFIIGSALVLGAIVGNRFYVGLSPKIKVPIPAWQGRVWLLISGGLLLLVALDGVLGPSQEGARHFIERVSVTLDSGYEMFGGVIAVIVGVVFLLPGRQKIDIQARLLGAGLAFVGAILISDSLWKMMR